MPDEVANYAFLKNFVVFLPNFHRLWFDNLKIMTIKQKKVLEVPILMPTTNIILLKLQPLKWNVTFSPRKGFFLYSIVAKSKTKSTQKPS